MNKEFIKKMLKAEKLRYEAIKEIMPERIKTKVENLERDAFELLKDVAIDLIREDTKQDTNSSKKAAQKVEVDFS
jgi:hypothetical protein